VAVRGANLVPFDSYESRVRDDDIDYMVHAARDAHFNMLRVWGGGIYQRDHFYERCDELGLLVWQEAMAACAMLPSDRRYLRSLRAEIEQQVRRLSSHASVALWSGNNENEVALGWFNVTRQYRETYLQMYTRVYYDTVLATITTIDPSRSVWPSSPSSGFAVADRSRRLFVGAWGNGDATTVGDVHYYNYTSDCEDWRYYPKTRFASEFGWQAFPAAAAWVTDAGATESDMKSAFTPFMMHRQHHVNGTRQQVIQISRHFSTATVNDTERRGAPLPLWSYLSQLQQARCVGTEAEQYRRLRLDSSVQCHGLLFWQLNDVWTAPTWSAIEYRGRFKALMYHAQQYFYSPLLVSARTEYVDNSATSRSAPNGVSVYIVNDYAPAAHSGGGGGGSRNGGGGGWWKIELVPYDARNSSHVLRSWSGVWSGAGGQVWHYPHVLRATDGFLRLSAGHSTTTTTTVTAAAVKEAAPFTSIAVNEYHAPGVFKQLAAAASGATTTKTTTTPCAHVNVTHVEQLSATSARVHLSTDRTALFVAIDSAVVAGHFSYNYATLYPGEQYVLTFTARRTFDALLELAPSLTAVSLCDTFGVV